MCVAYRLSFVVCTWSLSVACCLVIAVCNRFLFVVCSLSFALFFFVKCCSVSDVCCLFVVCWLLFYCPLSVVVRGSLVIVCGCL